MEENIKNSFNRIETIMNNEVCEFNKTIIEGNLNVIKRYIENLIQENKKLKKQMGKDLDVVYIKGVYDERDKWKSKVKEKIEELEEQLKYNLFKNHEIYTVVENKLLHKIEVLQELLEEGE